VRIANCSGFYGDRLAAAAEMVAGGPIDVLTGDWLAELTMGLLARQRQRDPDGGYPATFLTQLREVLATCLDRGVRIVANAGGVNVDGCARAVEALAAELGRPCRVARVVGDDVTALVAARRDGGWVAPHLDTGEPVPGTPVLAHAYLGGWGIAAALEAGADVVVTGRVTDAALVLGPAAWRYGWARDDWDALAGAVAAGHVIECGAQATGGNYAFFTELDNLARPGFPIAEVEADGSAVITKHPGTGGAVTVETVTAQLLYESEGPRYANPDVVARFDTLRLTREGPDRVRISGTRGEPAPDTLKAGLLVPAGWRNSMTFVLTGLDIEAKAALAQQALWALVPREAYAEVEARLVRADRPDPAHYTDAVAYLTVAVRAADQKLSRAFSAAAVQTALAGYPGLYFTEPPGAGTAVTEFWPTLLPAAEVTQEVVLDDRRWPVPPTPPAAAPPIPAPDAAAVPPPSGETTRVPLGTIAGARSGDKAGNATLGLWARTDPAYAWLRGWLTDDRLRELLPEAAGCQLRRWELPHLRAVGFTVVGYLGRGVAGNLHLDVQAKGLAEYLRAKHADIPSTLL
jgi:Acyclic terpene utilisation family protein AtuA